MSQQKKEPTKEEPMEEKLNSVARLELRALKIFADIVKSVEFRKESLTTNWKMELVLSLRVCVCVLVIAQLRKK